MPAQSLRVCYRCRAANTLSTCVDFDGYKQGVSDKEIPLCPGLDILSVQFSTHGHT